MSQILHKAIPLYPDTYQAAHSQHVSTDQRAEQIHRLQHQLLVSDPGHAELLQVLMRDLQQLLPADLLPLKVGHILLQVVVQT